MMAAAIMISGFGCNNGLILSGARVYYAMAKDGLFFRNVAKLHPKYKTPAVSLMVQMVWACLLCVSGSYGQLLDYIIFAVLVFYILTIVGLFVLRRTHPDALRPYRAVGYPVLPIIYIVMALFIDVVLLRYKPQYTWPGLIVVLLGIPVYYAWSQEVARGAQVRPAKLQGETKGMANLFAKKDLPTLMKEAVEVEGEHSLRRALGPLNLLTLGIGAIIGAGIFVITGQAAAQFAGPAIVISFVLAGIACAFAGLCYAEFASMIPIAGSAYTYSYATLGELVAWIIGWDLILEYAFGAATVAVGWSGHLRAFLHDLGRNLPPFPTSDFTLFGMPVHLKYDYVGFLVIMVITTILVIGIKESANFTTAIVILKVAVVCMFIALAAAFLFSHAWQPNYWHPFIPANTGEWGHFGWSGILRGAGVVFFAYIGFDAVSTAAQEAKNPKKDMPLGILGSLVICTVLYILVSGLLTHIVPYHAAQCSRSGRRRYSRYRPAMGDVSGGNRRAGRPGHGDAGDAARAVARVLLDVAGWLALALGGEDSSPFRTPYLSSIVVGIFVAILATLIPLNVSG